VEIELGPSYILFHHGENFDAQDNVLYQFLTGKLHAIHCYLSKHTVSLSLLNYHFFFQVNH